MAKVNPFTYDVTSAGTDSAINGYIYTDIFDSNFLQSVKNTVTSILDSHDTKTFLTHGTKFQFEGKEVRLISHKQNAREQIVIFDNTCNSEWYYQTKDTIRQWADDTIKNNVHPVFYKVIKILEGLEPFSNDKEDYIFTRLHINYLEPGKYLALHYDSSAGTYDVNNAVEGHRVARVRSVTFYLYDHIEGKGGEFWTLSGFVYKPKENTAININGNQFMHGVTTNVNDSPRLAFTLRAVHKDDLYLPGNPDKFLYDVNQWS